jgi:hypothetical protein
MLVLDCMKPNVDYIKQPHCYFWNGMMTLFIEEKYFWNVEVSAVQIRYYITNLTS